MIRKHLVVFLLLLAFAIAISAAATITTEPAGAAVNCQTGAMVPQQDLGDTTVWDSRRGYPNLSNLPTAGHWLSAASFAATRLISGVDEGAPYSCAQLHVYVVKGGTLCVWRAKYSRELAETSAQRIPPVAFKVGCFTVGQGRWKTLEIGPKAVGSVFHQQQINTLVFDGSAAIASSQNPGHEPFITIDAPASTGG